MEHDTPESSKSKPILPNGEILSKDEDSLPRTPLPMQHVGAGVGVLLTLLTIILFASGQGYREGYLSGFSVDILQVPISFQETLYWGFIVIVFYGVPFLLPLAIAAIVLSVLIVFAGKLQQRFQKPRQKKPAEKPTTKKHLPELIPIFLFFGWSAILLAYVFSILAFVFSIGYWIPKSATNNGRTQAETTINEFKKDATKAAKTYKLHCLHMSWEKEDSGKAREMYVYQFFCNDKLCKVFEPKTKTFPIVFLDGIRSIAPYEIPAGQKSCRNPVSATNEAKKEASK